MADPVSLATIGMAASAAGAGVSAMGQMYQGRAQANLANYQAGIADINAKLAKADANYASQVGETEAEREGLKTHALIAQSRVGFAAGNISLSGGSAARVVNSELAIGQQGVGILRANAAKRAFGYEVTAMQDTAQGGVYRTAALTAPIAAEYGATSSILGGVGSVSSEYLRAKTAGINVLGA